MSDQKNSADVIADLERRIDTMQNIVEAGVLVTKYGRFNAGDKFPVKETIHFIKTEQGWRIKTPAS